MVNKVISADPRLRKAAGGNAPSRDGQHRPVPGAGSATPPGAKSNIHGGPGAAIKADAANRKHLNDFNRAVASAPADAKRAADAARNARSGPSNCSPYQPKNGG